MLSLPWGVGSFELFSHIPELLCECAGPKLILAVTDVETACQPAGWLTVGPQQAAKPNNLLMLDTGSFKDAHGRLMKARRWTKPVSQVLLHWHLHPPARCFSAHSFLFFPFCIFYFVIGMGHLLFGFMMFSHLLSFLLYRWYVYKECRVYIITVNVFTVRLLIFNVSQGKFEISPKWLELATAIGS